MHIKEIKMIIKRNKHNKYYIYSMDTPKQATIRTLTDHIIHKPVINRVQSACSCTTVINQISFFTTATSVLML